MRRAVWGFLLLLLAVLAIEAANTGAIKGYVKDPTGKVIPGADLVLRSVQTGSLVKATTDGNGFYQFLELAPGTFEMTVQVPGFRKVDVKNINVLLDQIVSYDAQLELGQVTQVVEVNGGVNALIEPEKISTGADIAPSSVESLPVINRTFDSFWLLTPGATQAATGSQSGSNSISTAGARTGAMNELIDGINNMSRQSDSVINNYRIADAVSEFSVTTTVAPADTGRGTGAQVNVITKNGTDVFHGSAFEFLRNNDLQADNYFQNALNGVKPALRQNQFGGTIGGPIRKDKTFFFFSWESQHLVNPAVSTAVVPTAAQRATILDPIAANLVQFYPSPNVAGAAAGTANVVFNANSTNVDNTYLTRIDHQFSDKNKFSAHYIYYHGDSIIPGSLPTVGGYTSKPGAQSWMFSDTHVFSPTFIAEVRAGSSRSDVNMLAQDYGLNAQTYLPGVPGVVDGATDKEASGIPSFSITGFTGRSDAASLPQIQVISVYDSYLNITKLRPFGWSRHTFKIGADARREETKRLNDAGVTGSLSFTSFANFAGTCATCAGQSLLSSSSILNGTSLAYWYRYPFAFYFQDDIKLKPNLTLNIGVRYEYPSAIVEKSNRGTNFLDGWGPVKVDTNQLLQINPALTGPGSIYYTQVPFTLPRAGYIHDTKNFAPIVGFAYTPEFGSGILKDGKTVIRGGFRISYDEVYNNVTVNQSIAAPWNYTITQQAGTTQPAAGYGWNYAFNLNVPFISRTTQAPGAPAVGLLNFYGLTEDCPSAYAYNYNLGIQRQIVSKVSLDVSYIGSAGHHIGDYVNPNQAVPVINNPGYRGNQAPNSEFFPYPEFGSSRIANFQVNSIYGGLVITAKVHTGKLVDLVSSYNWSHAIDDGSAWTTNSFDQNMPVSRFLMPEERANSSNDQRQKLLNYFVLSLPFGAGQKYLSGAHGVLNQLVAGWRISAVNSIVTGQPFTVYANHSVDFSGFDTLNDRPNIQMSGPLQLNQGSPYNWFSPAYFGKVAGNPICPGYASASGVNVNSGCAPPGVVGDSPRNAYRLPGAVNLDTTLAKRFPLHAERIGLTFRADFFNVMNHTNFLASSNSAVMSSGQFGTLTAAGTPRTVQLTLRLDF